MAASVFGLLLRPDRRHLGGAPLSIEATEKFQNAFDLGNDGIFGPMTETKTISLIRSIQKAITDGSIAIDGLAGPETQRRTIQWQAAHGLPTTGEADEADYIAELQRLGVAL